MIRSRAGRFRVRRSGSSLHHWHRGPGPTTELSSQTVADLEPDGPIFESDGAGANKPHTLRTWSGAGPTTELSSQNVDVRSPSRTERSSCASPRTWAAAGPTTELSSQTVEPDGPSPSRTEREPTSPTRCGPGPEPDPLLSYPARTWMSGAGRADKSESDGAGALHAADLGRSRA